jgi:hypothetical protein
MMTAINPLTEDDVRQMQTFIFLACSIGWIRMNVIASPKASVNLWRNAVTLSASIVMRIVSADAAGLCRRMAEEVLNSGETANEPQLFAACFDDVYADTEDVASGDLMELRPQCGNGSNRLGLFAPHRCRPNSAVLNCSVLRLGKGSMSLRSALLFI